MTAKDRLTESPAPWAGGQWQGFGIYLELGAAISIGAGIDVLTVGRDFSGLGPPVNPEPRVPLCAQGGRERQPPLTTPSVRAGAWEWFWGTDVGWS